MKRKTAIQTMARYGNVGQDFGTVYVRIDDVTVSAHFNGSDRVESVWARENGFLAYRRPTVADALAYALNRSNRETSALCSGRIVQVSEQWEPTRSGSVRSYVNVTVDGADVVSGNPEFSGLALGALESGECYALADWIEEHATTRDDYMIRA